jgi:hypothetical protein
VRKRAEMAATSYRTVVENATNIIPKVSKKGLKSEPKLGPGGVGKMSRAPKERYPKHIPYVALSGTLRGVVLGPKWRPEPSFSRAVF